MVLRRPQILEDVLYVVVLTHLVVRCAWPYVSLSHSCSNFVTFKGRRIDEVEVKLAGLYKFHVDSTSVELLLTHFLAIEILGIRFAVVVGTCHLVA